MPTKDQKEEEKKKEEEEQKKKNTRTFWDKIPGIWKIGGVIFIVLMLSKIQTEGGDTGQIMFWGLVVLVVWYLIGSENLKKESDVLTPEEAEYCASKELVRLKNTGRIPTDAVVKLSMNSLLHEHEGLPQHYLIGLTILHQYRTKHARMMVHAEGDTKGYATIQAVKAYFTGREKAPTVSLIPGWMKRTKEMERYGFKGTDFLFGGKP